MIRVFAIDPGPQVSGYCVWDGEKILEFGNPDNEWLLNYLLDRGLMSRVRLAIEKIVPQSKMGASTIDTVFWAGRFYQAYKMPGEPVLLVPRAKVKLHHLHSESGCDSDIIYTLTQRFRGKGTKKSPGLTYGLTSHAWQAFALAVYVYDSLK